MYHLLGMRLTIWSKELYVPAIKMNEQADNEDKEVGDGTFQVLLFIPAPFLQELEPHDGRDPE